MIQLPSGHQKEWILVKVSSGLSIVLVSGKHSNQMMWERTANPTSP